MGEPLLLDIPGHRVLDVSIEHSDDLMWTPVPEITSLEAVTR